MRDVLLFERILEVFLLLDGLEIIDYQYLTSSQDCYFLGELLHRDVYRRYVRRSVDVFVDYIGC